MLIILLVIAGTMAVLYMNGIIFNKTVMLSKMRRSIEEFAVALGVTEEDAEARLAQAALN